MPRLLAVAINNRSPGSRSEEHTSELQSRQYLVCRLLLEKKKNKKTFSKPAPYSPANHVFTTNNVNYLGTTALTQTLSVTHIIPINATPLALRLHLPYHTH